MLSPSAVQPRHWQREGGTWNAWWGEKAMLQLRPVTSYENGDCSICASVDELLSPLFSVLIWNLLAVLMLLILEGLWLNWPWYHHQEDYMCPWLRIPIISQIKNSEEPKTQRGWSLLVTSHGPSRSTLHPSSAHSVPDEAGLYGLYTNSRTCLLPSGWCGQWEVPKRYRRWEKGEVEVFSCHPPAYRVALAWVYPSMEGHIFYEAALPM